MFKNADWFRWFVLIKQAVTDTRLSLSSFNTKEAVIQQKACHSMDVARGPGDLHPVMLKPVMTRSIPAALQVLPVTSLIEDIPPFPGRFN